MGLIESVILHCLKKLNNERTIFSIYHLLNGKKSSQTIQDAHLFSLKRFFGICEGLTRESFEEIMDQLHKKDWVSLSGEQRFYLTLTGEEMLEKHPVPPFLNGWEYGKLTSLFWERLSLFIQVISNLTFQENNYIPIQKDREIQAWIKAVLNKLKIPKLDIGSIVYQELADCFSNVEGVNPALLIFRLTGYQQIGLTAEQAARRFNLPSFDYQIAFVQALHFLLSRVIQDPERFPTLKFLIHDIKKNNELTLSTSKTLELLNQDYSLEMIAVKRNLKLNTIEDHIVELALHLENFSIDPYVDGALQNEILTISRESGSRQLKLIRNKVKTASYFQIRLVLAKNGGG